MALTIWCNSELSDDALAALRAGTTGHRLIMASDPTSNLGSANPGETLSDVDVAFGQPDPGQVIKSERLKWVHLTSAGYTRYDRDDLREALISRKAVLTNSSSVFDEPCAQHLLAFMLAIARALPESMAAQLGTPSWEYAALRPVTRVLRNQKVLILSYGAIARRLIELLAPFRLEITAVRRKVEGDEVVPTFENSRLAELLPDADHVVNILPASPSTNGSIDAKAFGEMKPGATFYNVGRGTTVDQPALIDALNKGHLRAAYLDVTDPEPLPSDHPLWKAPNCYITPHIAGGHSEEMTSLVDHFLQNLRRYENSFPLQDVVFG